MAAQRVKAYGKKTIKITWCMHPFLCKSPSWTICIVFVSHQCTALPSVIFSSLFGFLWWESCPFDVGIVATLDVQASCPWVFCRYPARPSPGLLALFPQLLLIFWFLGAIPVATKSWQRIFDGIECSLRTGYSIVSIVCWLSQSLEKSQAYLTTPSIHWDKPNIFVPHFQLIESRFLRSLHRPHQMKPPNTNAYVMYLLWSLPSKWVEWCISHDRFQPSQIVRDSPRNHE